MEDRVCSRLISGWVDRVEDKQKRAMNANEKQNPLFAPFSKQHVKCEMAVEQNVSLMTLKHRMTVKRTIINRISKPVYRKITWLHSHHFI